MPATHRLSFLIEPRAGGALTLTPCIDGIALTDIAAAYDIARGFDPPARGYGGIVPEYMKYGPLDVYFTGGPGPVADMLRGRRYLLGCQCGEVGCRPLTAQIVRLPDAYEWRDFSNPQAELDDAGLGPFRFEAAHYEQVVRQMTKEFDGRRSA